MKEMEHMLSKLSIVLETPGHEDVESLLRIRDLCDRNRRLLCDRLAVADRQMEAINLLIEFARGVSEPASAKRLTSSAGTVECPVTALLEIESATAEAGPISGVATVQDIAHCRTQREASYVIAEKNGGPIDLKSAALVIKAAGLSKGMVGTVVSSLHNFMSYSGDWVYSGPSKFQLVAAQEAESEAESLADSGYADSSETNDEEGDWMRARTMEETAA